MYSKIKNMDLSIKIGLVGMVIYALLTIIAMLTYPNYNQFDQTLSKLGARWPSSLYFSLGIIVGALTIAWLVLSLKDDVIILFPNSKKDFQKIGILFILIFTLMIALVFFPSADITSDIHDVIAISLFIIIAIVTSWVSMIAKSSLPKWNKYISYLGYACSISVVILGLLLIFWEFGPLIQKITVLEFNIWILLVAHQFKRYVPNSQ